MARGRRLLLPPVSVSLDSKLGIPYYQLAGREARMGVFYTSAFISLSWQDTNIRNDSKLSDEIFSH
jgi:hypothetical protein